MSFNVQGISEADLRFINIVARWPGSTHDARIFDNSLICTRFENNELTGLLLGDSGYPCRPFLMTPYRNPNGPAENRYNRAQRRTRSLVERMFGVWKRRFPCLKFGIRCKLTTAMAVIVATAVLHNTLYCDWSRRRRFCGWKWWPWNGRWWWSRGQYCQHAEWCASECYKANNCATIFSVNKSIQTFKEIWTLLLHLLIDIKQRITWLIFRIRCWARLLMQTRYEVLL